MQIVAIFFCGSIYPEKWATLENKGQYRKVNLENQLTYKINNMLGFEKPGFRAKFRTNWDMVTTPETEPK